MKTYICAAFAFGMLTSSAAYAQNHNPNNQQGPAYNAGSDWRQGDVVPSQYNNDSYVVNDWQQRGLHNPGTQYKWVRNGDRQYVLTGRRTGRIYEVSTITSDSGMGYSQQTASGYGYATDWHQGDIVPTQYNSDAYVVNDWQQRGLHNPGTQYKWVRNGDRQYVLTGRRTGRIYEVSTITSNVATGYGQPPMNGNSGYNNNSGYNHSGNDYAADWHQGEIVPAQYNNDAYVVNDWQQRGLHNPGTQYKWVRNGDRQYALTGRRTGRIYEISNGMNQGTVSGQVATGPRMDDRTWHIGDRVDDATIRQGYVADYGNHGLPRPRPGHTWVQLNGHYVLVDSSSHSVLQVR